MSEIEISAIAADFASGSDKRAEKAAQELAAQGTQNLAGYSLLLNDLNVDVRWWAVRSLAEIKSPDATTLRLHSLNDADISVRQCAALALQQQPDPRAVPSLVQLLNSREHLLGRLAGDALIAIGSDAVPALLEVMGDNHPKARIEAARALAESRPIERNFREILDVYNAALERKGRAERF